MTDRLLRLDAVLDRLGMGRSAFYAHVKAKRIAAPVKIGHAARWRESDIERGIRIAAPALALRAARVAVPPSVPPKRGRGNRTGPADTKMVRPSPGRRARFRATRTFCGAGVKSVDAGAVTRYDGGSSTARRLS